MFLESIGRDQPILINSILQGEPQSIKPIIVDLKSNGYNRSRSEHHLQSTGWCQGQEIGFRLDLMKPSTDYAWQEPPNIKYFYFATFQEVAIVGFRKLHLII